MALGRKRKAADRLSKQPLDLPAATIHAYAGTDAPDGWAMCDGVEVNRVDNAALFAVIGVTYGVGDGSLTFNLPDMRGEFLRGLDNMGTVAGAAGKDVDGTARTVGQLQTDAFKTHNHRLGGGAGLVGGGSQGYAASNNTSFSSNVYTYSNGNPSETRPVNMAISYIIKL